MLDKLRLIERLGGKIGSLIFEYSTATDEIRFSVSVPKTMDIHQLTTAILDGIIRDLERQSDQLPF